MKKLFLPLGLFSLMFCGGCGSSGPGPFIPKGNFSNASLKGQYVYQLSGTDTTNGVNAFPYYEAGVFVADGIGNLTNVSDDFSEGATPTLTTGAGTYSIKNDGTGSLTLNNALGTVTLAVTIVSSSKAYLIEADAGLNSSGMAELQDSTATSSAPGGTFAFRLHTANTSQMFSLSAASVGVFTASGGTVSTGTMDVDRGGTLNNGTASPLTFTGSFNAPPNLGRGTGTFTDSSNTTLSFIYYVVDANNVRFLSSSSGLLGIGRAEKQSSPALSGSYAFGGRGNTVNNGINAVDTVGAFSASGGSITTGAIDAVEDGSNLSTTISGGSYTTTANGRATVTLNASSGTVQATFWMVSPSRGFFLITNDSNAVEDGTLDLQSGTFTNATMNGQFAFMMDGFDTTQLLDRLGTLTWDGTSKLTLNEVANSSATGQGAISPGVLTGNYSVSSNGRAVGTISNLSLTNNDLVFYLISGSDAYLLQNDSGVQINGMISLQH
ncbi:MAG TPA: hypothetical protein VMO80_03650 [Terriglobales bacterium]|jgi:hypothetical protein|nr:hypothetical protein [Terriglobales bacterium]